MGYVLWQILLYLGRPASWLLFTICGTILTVTYGVWFYLMAHDRCDVGATPAITRPNLRQVPPDFNGTVSTLPLRGAKVRPVTAPAGKARARG